jgi:hypothetical protein
MSGQGGEAAAQRGEAERRRAPAGQGGEAAAQRGKAERSAGPRGQGGEAAAQRGEAERRLDPRPGPAPARRAADAAPIRLVGRDFAEQRGGRTSRGFVAVLVGAAVVVGLALAALRNDLIRMRYDLSEAMQQERELLEARRELTAKLVALRDPARLARLARERGFVRPERVLAVGAPEGGAR